MNKLKMSELLKMYSELTLKYEEYITTMNDASKLYAIHDHFHAQEILKQANYLRWETITLKAKIDAIEIQEPDSGSDKP